MKDSFHVVRKRKRGPSPLIRSGFESAVLAMLLGEDPGHLDLCRRSLKWFHLSATGSRRRIWVAGYKSWWKRTRSPRDARYRRYFIYRTKTVLPPFSSTSASYLLLIWSGHGRPEVGIRINIRRWRTKLQAVLSAALAVHRVVVAAAAADAGFCCCCCSSRPARKQMSDDHLVHSGAQWETTTWNHRRHGVLDIG